MDINKTQCGQKARRYHCSQNSFYFFANSQCRIIMPLQNVDGDDSPRTPDSYLSETFVYVFSIANRIFVCFSILSKYDGDSGGFFQKKAPVNCWNMSVTLKKSLIILSHGQISVTQSTTQRKYENWFSATSLTHFHTIFKQRAIIIILSNEMSIPCIKYYTLKSYIYQSLETSLIFWFVCDNYML